MPTATYEAVFEQARQLAPEERERLIEALEEIVERRWDASFAGSQDALARMAARALADFDTDPIPPATDL